MWALPTRPLLACPLDSYPSHPAELSAASALHLTTHMLLPLLQSSSCMSAAREATMGRIRDLEGDLATARRERETLEANIEHLKATFHAASPTGHVSGGPFEA